MKAVFSRNAARVSPANRFRNRALASPVRLTCPRRDTSLDILSVLSEKRLLSLYSYVLYVYSVPSPRSLTVSLRSQGCPPQGALGILKVAGSV